MICRLSHSSSGTSTGMIAAMDTPVGMGRMFTMALPFAVRPPCARHVFSLYAIPSVVKNNSCVCVLATNRVVTTSSSLVCIPDRPLPPRRCTEIGQGCAFDVSACSDSHDHIFAFDQVLVFHVPRPFNDLGATGHGELGFHLSNSVRMMPMMRSRGKDFQIFADFARQFLCSPVSPDVDLHVAAACSRIISTSFQRL